MPRLVKNVKTSAEKAGIESVDQKVKEIKSVIAPDVPVPEKKERKKRVLSEEQKQALRDRLVKAREVRASKRAEQKKNE